jgi:hypothetical protein
MVEKRSSYHDDQGGEECEEGVHVQSRDEGDQESRYDQASPRVFRKVIDYEFHHGEEPTPNGVLDGLGRGGKELDQLLHFVPGFIGSMRDLTFTLLS